MAAPACRLSCRCCTEQSGRHPCSVDRSRNRVHSKHSLRLAHGLAAAASACPLSSSPPKSETESVSQTSQHLPTRYDPDETGCMDRMIDVAHVARTDPRPPFYIHK